METEKLTSIEEEIVKLTSIEELAEMYFLIPSYQRGYRWQEEQVKDLLEDIREFSLQKKEEEIYCLQPLVIKKSENFWEVIDGQQRLTTIYILLSYLNVKNTFQIEYETRKNSQEFVENLHQKNEEDAKENIDFFHMYQALQTIRKWCETNLKGKEELTTFKETLLKNTKFIKYISDEKNPIKVFTRLNIGKIALTDSELIKALFLNRVHFQSKSIHIQQQEIATQWDAIEYTLQNDEFWLFICNTEYSKPTRIDFIFELMKEQNTLNLSDDEYKRIGNDEHQVFRYFYEHFKSKKGSDEFISSAWGNVKKYFQIFQEWFNDLELYHYIGYLITLGEKQVKIPELIKEWEKTEQTKSQFLSFIKEHIKKSLSQCKDLNQIYDNGTPKTACKPLLLLHNIETIINQNNQLKTSQKYGLPIFYKFPFHLFKRENWDVEHIDSNTENSIEDKKSRVEWLKDIAIESSDNNRENILSLISDIQKETDKEHQTQKFQEIKSKYDNLEKGKEEKGKERLSDEEKNQVWNFCLLDSSTNRGYGNAIFPAKRRTIIAKDQGKKIVIDDNLEIEEESNSTIAFVPPVTKNIFLKYYTLTTNPLRAWTKEDAQNYKKNIEKVLKDFLN